MIFSRTQQKNLAVLKITGGIFSIRFLLLIAGREHLLLTYWFLGTLFLLIAFTTSFSEYKPLDLKRSWYIYPLLAPTIILSAILINQLKKYLKYFLMIVYIIGGIIMSTHYEVYFDKENVYNLKTFLREHQDKKIFTDHFTKYSVDLLRNYKDLTKSNRILGENFSWEFVKPREWVLINQIHIDELKLQRHKFPDFSILQSKLFNKIDQFGYFIIYEKIP
jgi:hypothetical protein